MPLFGRRSNLVILCRSGLSEALQALAAPYTKNTICLNTKNELLAAPLDNSVLIAFSTGVIVPESALKKVSSAYNLHPGSPNYPGRDPHYWAMNDGADRFGCTAHVMDLVVDSGDIINTVLFDVVETDTAEVLRAKAEIVGLRLFEDLVSAVLEGTVDSAETFWSGITRTRKDFYRCNLTFEPDQEIELSGLEDYDLGNAFFFGIRVPQNKELAKQYYIKAASSGSRRASEKLEQLF
jgi:methionyl-tRNA formyltransferase